MSSGMDFWWFWKSFRSHFETYFSFFALWISRFRKKSSLRSVRKNQCFVEVFCSPRDVWNDQIYNCFIKKSIRKKKRFQSRDFIDLEWLLEPKCPPFGDFWAWMVGSGGPWGSSGCSNWCKARNIDQKYPQNDSKVIKMSSTSNQNVIPKSSKRKQIWHEHYYL